MSELHNFMKGGNNGNLNDREKEDEKIELSLGLSLNGKFGVDPTTKINQQQLKRSFSSITALGETTRVDNAAATWNNNSLSRTCSLPVEVEDESRRRRRKELQMIRRREAKRRRSEKQRSNSIVAAALVAETEDGDGDGDDDDDESLPQIVSQGSSGSSSGLYEFDSQTRTTPPPRSHGINKVSEAKSPQSVQSFSDHNEERPLTASPLPKQSKSVSETNGMMKNVLPDMPCVSTTGVGPNGKRVDGFLYRYKKGEEVRIVCVCHGNFLTPAEFIKHAGGGEVENPLRHIVVSSSPFL